jgi:hypothetical protein
VRLIASAQGAINGVTAKAAAVLKTSLRFIGLGLCGFSLSGKINPGIVDRPGFYVLKEYSY